MKDRIKKESSQDLDNQRSTMISANKEIYQENWSQPAILSLDIFPIISLLLLYSFYIVALITFVLSNLLFFCGSLYLNFDPYIGRKTQLL